MNRKAATKKAAPSELVVDRQEIATAQGEPRSDSAALMSVIETVARDKEFDPQRLRELLQIKREFEAEESRRMYAHHMAKAQAKILPVVADADNQQTNSKYARLATIVQAIAPTYTAEGFSVSYGTGEAASERLREAGWIGFTARCLHSGGHFEDYSVDLPSDMTGAKGNVNKTAIHGTKSSITYARGILLGLIFNFTTSLDVDDDGNGAGPRPEKEPEPADEKQLAIIQEFKDENKIPAITLKWLDKQESLTYPQAAALIKKLKEAETNGAA